jgi:signal transduction histidine kinase
MSRRIALAHGGDLVLEPGGGGASFLLTLPAEER